MPSQHGKVIRYKNTVKSHTTVTLLIKYHHFQVTYHHSAKSHTIIGKSHSSTVKSPTIRGLSSLRVVQQRAIFSDKSYLKSALPPFVVPSSCLTSLYTAHEYDRVPTLKLYPSLCYPAAAQLPSVAGEQKNDHMKKSTKHKCHVNRQPNSKVSMQIFKSFKKCI